MTNRERFEKRIKDHVLRFSFTHTEIIHRYRDFNVGDDGYPRDLECALEKAFVKAMVYECVELVKSFGEDVKSRKKPRFPYRPRLKKKNQIITQTQAEGNIV